MVLASLNFEKISYRKLRKVKDYNNNCLALLTEAVSGVAVVGFWEGAEPYVLNGEKELVSSGSIGAIFES